ncbi:unnamed protein product [Blepharisma stoltei]|uniref:non-specific serine/threonine protein kinase n=1 Tax=Blepharisma stoltei TaxID=1481888 RepID=A0AAU9I471_9CILI|nr:unnamed protein product [Blepharisma stoltei]
MKNEEVDISGREINGFRVIKPIGQGKFSIVYKAERISDDTPVALKMIKIFDMMDPAQRDKCLKEVRLLESLNHPNIIKYLDSFIADNELLIAIEWAEKGDLKRVIKRAQSEESSIEESKIWEYMYQIASALKHMHDKRIMHRDLKPANIFISADNSLKLGDLGLGRYLSSQTIEAFSRVGTPLYMSPEVLKGNGYDWKSDVWSLGCVVYELACLRSPFKQDDQKMSLYDLFNTINKGEFPPLPERYSEELRQLVNSMIQVDPKNRLSIDQIVELCEIHTKTAPKKSKIDPFLVMDDIYEKLKLLDYENNFCKIFKRQPVSRVYFCHPIDSQTQLAYCYDLANWLMSFSKLKQRKGPISSPLGPVLDFDSFADPREVSKQILSDARSFGAKIPESVTFQSISLGYGESVCYLINELLNKELIRRDFKFLAPTINGQEIYKIDTNSGEEIFEEIDADFNENNIMKYNEQVEEDEEPPRTESTNISDNVIKEEEIAMGIVESSVSPEEWMAEVQRIEKQLVYAEEDIGLYEEDWQSRIQQFIESLHNVQKFVTEGNLKYLEKMTDGLTEELERINKGEVIIQKFCQKDIDELKLIMQKKKELAGKLNYVRNKVSQQCEEFDKIKEQENTLNKTIEKRVSELNDTNPLEGIKAGLLSLKEQIKSLNYETALARFQLDQFSSKG